ncbi:hypothetical protein HPP92_011915 [Vanilla planifolia]|uniref:Uncharacterized protein n=1 Tax=Vanilla planifolia TaxID=51239 RepID=A0A835V0M6_VANPL|nr:hypothetical protein HPP92_011915 [Vanilla planifolia]
MPLCSDPWGTSRREEGVTVVHGLLPPTKTPPICVKCCRGTVGPGNRRVVHHDEPGTVGKPGRYRIGFNTGLRPSHPAVPAEAPL